MTSVTPPAPETRRRIAVVGSGVAGLTAAYALTRSNIDVTLIEADDRLGGHADTHQVGDLGIDTGFIVHNQRTYPVLLGVFADLGIATQESEMSMSVSDDDTGLEWAGALGRRGVFPTRSHLVDPAYLRMLVEIPRFHRHARAVLAAQASGGYDAQADTTLRDFLAAGRYSTYFTRHFMEPVVAAVWSCDPAVALDYPARYLFAFLSHHGMLSIFGSPTWRTVTGGSRQYVAGVAARIDEIRIDTKVTSVLETSGGVEVTDGNGATTTYDAVVIAAHPSQALTMLAEPTTAQREILGALPYSPNVALLHTDTTLLPRTENTWASWNFKRPADARPGEVTVTYDLTRLQRLPTDTHYLVTLGGEHLVDPATVIDRMEYEHPLYTPASVAAQARLPEIDTDRIGFAGAYHGWGFHEDGARSGLAAARRLGATWGLDTPARPSRALDHRTPRIYDTVITHTRRKPFKRVFTNRSRLWLVDLDELPNHAMLGRFEARDHLGDPDRSLRENVDAFLALHDVDRPTKVLMAANARAFGYCFNPISVFWCFNGPDDTGGPGDTGGPDGSHGGPTAVIVEVHNTYGDRHAYLVHPDSQGRARTDKAMYVSPFHGTDGHYELAVPVPGERLRIAVTLHSDEDAVFSAVTTGTPSSAGPLRAAPAALVGSLAIRAHGVWLWARRLPVRARPPHPHQERVQ